MEIRQRFKCYQEDVRCIFETDFPSIDVTKTLYFPCVNLAMQNIEWPTRHYAVVSFKQLFSARNLYPLKHKNNAKLLFFNQTDRVDHVQAFNKIVSLARLADAVQAKVIPHRIASFGVCLRRTCRLIGWIARKRKTNLSWREFWFTVPFVQLALEAKEQFENWDLEQYNAVVFYYDFNWISGVLRQMAELKGITTITLQHGIYFTKRIFPEEPDRLIICHSAANLFLAWNVLSKKMLMECGFPEEQILVMGIPRYLDSARLSMSKETGKGVFGVISSIAEYEDRQMIRIACDIAEKTGWRFYIRYHPLQQGNEYDRFVTSAYYLGNGGKFSVDQYATEVDFSLVGRSTMLLDLVARGKRAYHYRDERGYGAYPMEECAFCNAQQVIEMEKKLDVTQAQWDILQEKLLGPKNAKEKYTNFFQTLENKI